MKKIVFTLTLTLVFLGVVVSQSHAAEVVGNESYEVSWEGVPTDVADSFQVYYRQADNTPARMANNTIFDGLTSVSRRVKINNLKPCTTYNWSVRAVKAGVRSTWVRQGSFTTGGTCETPKAPVLAGATMVSNVGTWSNATNTKFGSSTITWSVVPQAAEYHIYYRASSDTKYMYSVKVPSNGNTVTINYLTPGVKYFYQIAAVVNDQEVWFGEKTLQAVNGEKPVLGVSTQAKPVTMQDKYGYQGVLGSTTTSPKNVLGAKTCTNTGKASVSVRIPSGVTADKVHIYYGKWSQNYNNALRDLQGTVREVTIANLDTCATYYYQVSIVGIDGKVRWEGEKVMSLWE